MRQTWREITVSAACALLAGTAWAQGTKPLKTCPLDSVVSGTVCMDKYEASVWRVPNPTTTNKSLVSKIQQGKATAADLTAGGDAARHRLDRRLRAMRRQRAKLRRRHLRGEPAGGETVGEPHVVPGPGGVRERTQTAAVERGVAGGGGRDAHPGPDNGTTDCRTSGARRSRPDRAAAACRRMGRSTWWATCGSGSRNGCRARRGAARGLRAPARLATTSA